MPNHVTNELHASPAILDALKVGENAVDFDTVLPMPESFRDQEPSLLVLDWASFALGRERDALFSPPPSRPDDVDLTEGGNTKDWTAVLHRSNLMRALSDGPFPKDFSEEDFEKFVTCMRNFRAHGYLYWFDWAREKWGTKWGAYESKRVSETVAQFQTAWSAPVPWVGALSKLHPEERLRLRWADEDWGCNVGEVVVQDGNLIDGGRHENNSPEAEAVATDLRGPKPVYEDDEEA